MPRTKFRKGFKWYPIIVMDRLDCFDGYELGMKIQSVYAREIKWPKDPLKGTSFLLHKVPGFHRKWTVTHADSGLDILGYARWSDSEEEAKQDGADRIHVIGTLMKWLLSRNHLKAPAVELQMIRDMRNNGNKHGYGDMEPSSYIQKSFIHDDSIKFVSKEMNYLRREKK